MEQLEPRLVLNGTAPAWGADIDWSDGSWGVKITDGGSPGSSAVIVTLPGGVQETGNALEVYHAIDANDTPQFWVFLTDGFWRQTSYEGAWGTSGRLFSYYSSDDNDPEKHRDKSLANHFEVVGVDGGGQLRLSLDYDNDSSVGDQFDIHADVTLLPPDQFHTVTDASITVTNVSGRDVVPAWPGHNDLAEQWELVGLSSMYVADNLSADLPSWYDSLDPTHTYVGITDDGTEYMNDGFSDNEQVTVYTHDVKRLVVGDQVLDLAHDDADCPHVPVPGYDETHLVMLDQPATDVRLIHAYDPAMNQRLQVLGASGRTDQLDDLKWAVAYDRTDTNMVDGDNIQARLGMDDFLGAWPVDASQTVQVRATTGAFPFSMSDGKFSYGSQPVFLNVIGYQPLEPTQHVGDALRLERIQDDLRRWQDYQGGGDPVALRVYAQPANDDPIRMPQEFYDGVRQLGFWIIRDIFVPEDIGSPDALDRARQAVDAVLDEVQSAGGLDRIFAWEIGNEFLGVNDYNALSDYLAAVRDYLKERLDEPAFAGASNWVTWATYPGKDLLRTDGNRVSVEMDYYSINAYPYDPERIRDHQPGPVTGTSYEGYLTALAEQAQREFPGKPVMITESGLPDAAAAVADGIQNRLHSWYSEYRKGGLNDQQVAEGLADLYFAARLSGQIAGLGFFEWNDEWWKAGDPNQQNHAEESFGISRFDTAVGGGYELRYKLQQQVVQDAFRLDFYSGAEILTGLAADTTTLPLGGSTTVRATLDPNVPGPVVFRWESSRGRVVGDSDTVEFYVGNVDLGPATVTCLAVDALGRAHRASVAIDIQSTGDPLIEFYTLGPVGSVPRVSGRVANVDLNQYKIALYIETNQQYVQPYADAPFVFPNVDGYWWTRAHTGAVGELIAWVVPKDFDVVGRPLGSPPQGTIAEARRATTAVNDNDNDLIDDGWETGKLGTLSQDRYDDLDGDLAYNLEEYLAGQAAQFVGGGNPTVMDNDIDIDDLPDNWEYRLLRTLQFGAGSDPDGDSLTTAVELSLGIHPGRTAPDRDQDKLPDRWEQRNFASLSAQPQDDPNNDGLTNLDAYELAYPPHSHFHAEGCDIVRDSSGEKTVFRGVNVTGLEYGSFFAYPYTGVLGTDYFQPREADFVELQNHGFNVVRVPFEWARLVPGWNPGDPLPVGLQAGYLGVLDEVVEMAGEHGLYVILDMHDFLKYWSGESEEEDVDGSPAHQYLLDYTWRLLAAHFAGNPTVLGYDLMNEPIHESVASDWHVISQRLVETIRQEDPYHLVFVEGPNYSLASNWPVENDAPWITDTVDPSRVVYSPHVYFDYANDSQYASPGEDVGPADHWEYYVRDRLLPAIDWSMEYDVPIFIGEVGVPSTSAWVELVDHTYRNFFDPLHLSVAAWHYIDPARNSADPLNLARLAGAVLLDKLAEFPGGTYSTPALLDPVPHDSLIYDDQRVNPWHKTGQNVGWWGDTIVDPSTATPKVVGEHSMMVEFKEQWDGLKFVHDFGLDSSRFETLQFCVHPTSVDLDFTIFTTGPKPESTEYPASVAARHRLAEYLQGNTCDVAGDWQLVAIPLVDIVDPNEPVITGIAFQEDGFPADPVFYLDQVALVPALTVTINQDAAQSDPTSASPIRFDVVFSQPVADFTADDVTVGSTASGDLAVAVAPVGADGTMYDVTVRGMTGSGTVVASIAAGTTHDAAGNPIGASTSTDNEVSFASWHNLALPCDVNNKDGVTTLDVLAIIVYINAHPGDTSLPAPPEVPPNYYDVNHDALVTTLDVLRAIDWINRYGAGSSEGEASEASMIGLAFSPTLAFGHSSPASHDATDRPFAESSSTPSDWKPTRYGHVPLVLLDERQTRRGVFGLLAGQSDSSVRRFVNEFDWEELGGESTELDAVLPEIAPDVARSSWQIGQRSE